MKLNLIYNSEIRNNGTPVYFWRAFREEGIDFKRYLPGFEMQPDADFNLWIDDGRDDLTWIPEGKPFAYYATDTHLGWDYRLWKAQQAQVVFCAQEPAAREMRRLGINAHWIPLGCDPLAHPTAGEFQARGGDSAPPKTFDITFCGHLQSPETSTRVPFLDRLFKEIPSFFFAYGVFHEDMARIYHRGRIGVNHAIRDDLNMRFFELASIGVPQLCDRRMVGISELRFVEDVHFIGYSSTDEAVEKVRLWLNRPQLLTEMAKAAHGKVRESHTYRHRVQAMMAIMGDYLGKTRDDVRGTENGGIPQAQ